MKGERREPETGSPADAGDLGEAGADVASWHGVSAAEVKGWLRTGRWA